MTVVIHSGDNRDTLRRMIEAGELVHSVVTDPPYGLVSIQKRFGKDGAAAARAEGNDGSFARLSGGFMGKAWDATGIERDPDFWRLIYDVLLPGGYVFAFSGSRTGHWQACAMEMAGFIMHPMHGWCFGQGFPKAHAADKAIDRALGVEGGFLADGAPVKWMIPGADQNRDGSWIKDNGREYQPGTQMTGIGDEGSAARFFHQFPPDPLIYQPKAGKEDRAGSRHPTVKPVALMQYLIRHITPPGGTVLDPFAGSGTTGEAALREGFDCILMEAEPEYVEFLRERFGGDLFGRMTT